MAFSRHSHVGTEQNGHLLLFRFVNLGPLLVRRSVFQELGGFNLSYSRPGFPGIGFDGEFSARAWLGGHEAAVLCPSLSTTFRNGCGGKGTAREGAVTSIRNHNERENKRRFLAQFGDVTERIEAQIERAQSALVADTSRLSRLRSLFPDCLACSESATAELFTEQYANSSAACEGGG